MDYTESFSIEGKTNFQDKWVFLGFEDETGKINPSPSYELAFERLTSIKNFLQMEEVNPKGKGRYTELRIIKTVTTIDTLYTETI